MGPRSGIIEENVFIRDWRLADLRVGVVYPSSYRVGMSGLTIKLLYGIVNEELGYLAERVFPQDFGALTIESRRNVRELDALLITVQFEFEYPWIVRLLREAGIPIRSSERRAGDPLVVVGGPCVMGNPTPILPFIDVLVNGEAEVALPPLLEAVASGGGRREVLGSIASFKWAYVPGLSSRPARRVYVESLRDAYFPVAQVITVEAPRPYMPIYGRKFIVETARGCGRNCRFCLSGYVYRPPRYRGLDRLEELTREGVRLTPSDSVMVIGTSAGDDPYFPEYLEFMASEGIRFSVPSIRADVVDERLARLIKMGGQRTLTIAPEAATERLQRIINKGVSLEDVRLAVEAASKAGIRSVKLYFMVGLPGESFDDVKEIPGFVSAATKTYPPRRVKISINPFVPKANTPFQWVEMPRPSELRYRVRWLASKLRKLGYIVEVASVEKAYLEALLARGGLKLSRVIEEVSLYDKPTLGVWRKALRRSGMDIYDGAKAPGFGREPWRKILDSGVSFRYLRWEFSRAGDASTTPGCFPGCRRCGLC